MVRCPTSPVGRESVGDDGRARAPLPGTGLGRTAPEGAGGSRCHQAPEPRAVAGGAVPGSVRRPSADPGPATPRCRADLAVRDDPAWNGIRCRWSAGRTASQVRAFRDAVGATSSAPMWPSRPSPTRRSTRPRRRGTRSRPRFGTNIGHQRAVGPARTTPDRGRLHRQGAMAIMSPRGRLGTAHVQHELAAR